MNPYRYELNNESLDIKPSTSTSATFLWVHEGRNQAAIIIPNADVPTVAAELLKAAGQDYLATYLVAMAEKEAADAEKRLQERRDAVAAEVFAPYGGTYGEANAVVRKIIDNIIRLQDGK